MEMPIEMQTIDEVEFSKNNNGYIRSRFIPFQQKIFYDCQADSSPYTAEDEADFENLLYLQPQPYTTPISVNYGPLYTQIKVQDYTKRSDVMITSTLSLSIFPRDKRKIC